MPAGAAGSGHSGPPFRRRGGRAPRVDRRRRPGSPPSRGRGLLVLDLRRDGALGFYLGRLGALLRPRLVELDAPLAVLVLLQREAGAEALAGAALEAGHGPLGTPGLDQLATGSCLPALPFQITNPQPGSSRDQHEYPLRFSMMSRPQTGHGPRLARGIRTSLSLWSSSPTVSSVNLTMSPMNAARESSPVSIFASRCSQSPVRPGLVSGCSPSSLTTLSPFSVTTRARASRSM